MNGQQISVPGVIKSRLSKVIGIQLLPNIIRMLRLRVLTLRGRPLLVPQVLLFLLIRKQLLNITGRLSPQGERCTVLKRDLKLHTQAILRNAVMTLRVLQIKLIMLEGMLSPTKRVRGGGMPLAPHCSSQVNCRLLVVSPCGHMRKKLPRKLRKTSRNSRKLLKK